MPKPQIIDEALGRMKYVACLSLILVDMDARLVFYSGHANRKRKMGLLYTKFYLDFDDTEWKQVSANPIIFEALDDNVVLDVESTSQNSYRVKFKKGGRLEMFRVVGKFRLTWNDEDVF